MHRGENVVPARKCFTQKGVHAVNGSQHRNLGYFECDNLCCDLSGSHAICRDLTRFGAPRPQVDDDTVTEFDPENIPKECFGGSQADGAGARSEKKIRNHNAFVLFYHRDGSGVDQHAWEGEQPTSPDNAGSAPLKQETSRTAPLKPPGVAYDVLGLERALARTNDRMSGGRTPYGGTSHPGLLEVMDTNQQVLRRALQFDPDYTASVIEFLRIQRAAGSCARASDMLCMGVTVFVRIVLHAADRPLLSDWEQVARLPSIPSLSLCI